jgi:hypothetical protein
MENHILPIDDAAQHTFYEPPKSVGGYRIGKELNGSIQFNLTYKPNRIHRFFMKICLGWYWFDQK